MNPISFWRLRRQWRGAQRLHEMEHEAKQKVSLSCDAVGHWEYIDRYCTIFGPDERRHFLREYRKWSA